MPRGIAIGRRGWDVPHLGPSSDPLAAALVGAAWGSPLRDIVGALPINAITNYPAHDAAGGIVGNATQRTPQRFRGMVGLAANRPMSLFASIALDSTSEKGYVVGICDTAGNDTGFGIGIGNTALDSTGNNICGVRGGINWTQSGAAIGTGRHSIGLTTDGSSNVQWFLDGVRVSTGGTGASWNLSGGAPALMLCSHSSGSTNAISAGVHVYFGAAWARILSSADFAALHEDPYRIVRA